MDRHRFDWKNAILFLGILLLGLQLVGAVYISYLKSNNCCSQQQDISLPQNRK